MIFRSVGFWNYKSSKHAYQGKFAKSSIRQNESVSTRGKLEARNKNLVINLKKNTKEVLSKNSSSVLESESSSDISVGELNINLKEDSK
jgi:hypothetical protein